MLNFHGILDKALLVSLLCLTLLARGPLVARAAATPILPGGLQTAPAVAPEATDASQAWKLRLEFKELNLQLVCVATLQDQASCFIKTPGSSEQMLYAVGDVIGGFRVTAINEQAVTFERQGATFPLALGQSSGAEAAAEPALDADLALRPGDVAIKLAESQLKLKTKRYATAKLLEDASSLRRSRFDGDSGSKSSGSRSVFANSFASPLQGELTSRYGYRRHPLGGGIRYHRGIDIAASYGAPIKAAASGRVTAVYNSTAHDLGRHITIKHNDEFETGYGHLSRCLVSVGQWVEKGDVIGREGSSGSSTGPHLHFEIRRNKQAVNPLSYMRLR